MRAALLGLLLVALAGPAGEGAGSAGRSIDLHADEVTLRQGGAVLEARGGVRITDGRIRLTADRAAYSVRTRRIVLSGHVTAAAPQATLRAATATVVLAADTTVQTVEASGQVALESRERTVRAERLTYAVGSGTVDAGGGVEVSIPPDVTGTGRALLMTPGEVLTLRGNARVQTKDGSIQGDRIDVAERTQIASVRGNVIGVFDETRVTSAAATFYGRERRAVFRHGVRVSRPGRTFHSDMVTIFLQDRRIVAEGTTTIRVEDEPLRP